MQGDEWPESGLAWRYSRSRPLASVRQKGVGNSYTVKVAGSHAVTVYQFVSGADRVVGIGVAPPTPSLIDGFETRRRPRRPQTTSLICRDPKV